ncbi:MAG: NAD(P)H-dependent oxidoreductase subunit E [Bacteroides sp.]|nr:MAG: NAD(P)H-dependent oxidoreductase subunit E [Bacteroides sp.]
MKLSYNQLKIIKNYIYNYPPNNRKSALIPILHKIQSYCNNWLSIESMDYVADLLKISKIEVYEVASFYTMFNLKPVGKHVLEVCQTAPCSLLGSLDIRKYIQKKLNIKPGENTQDGMFTLKNVECLAACGYGPVMQVGSKYFEKLNFNKIDIILEDLKKIKKHSTYC